MIRLSGMDGAACSVAPQDSHKPGEGQAGRGRYMLSQCLLSLGHKVVVVTRARGSR